MSLYETHLAKAEEFFDESNYEGARAALEHALESDPPENDCRAKALLGHVYRKLELDKEAIRLYEECLEVEETADVLGELALAFAEQSMESERALSLAMSALDKDPDVSPSYLALYLIHSSRGEYATALQYLKRGIRRGVEYSENRVFESLRAWCQALCSEEYYEEALALSGEMVDFFGNFEFYVLHARLADLAKEPRVAVEYYKKTLPFLRSGTPLRLEILEAIAKLAI